jgi:hypothetical protein
MTLVLSVFVLGPMLSKRITRTCRALCSQTGFLDPTSSSSTKKCHYLPACLLKSPLCGFFAQHPTKPLSYHRINTNIKHQAGEWAPLSDTPEGLKQFPKTTHSTTDHLRLVPELCLEAKEFGTYPIPSCDFKALLSIQMVICLPQIHNDLVQWLLLHPGQLLRQLSLNCCRPRPTLW